MPPCPLQETRRGQNLFVEAASAAGNQLTIIPAVLQLMDSLIDTGHINDDWSIIAKDAVN